MNIIQTPAAERWLNTSHLDKETAGEIIRYAHERLDDAHETHPVVALQAIVAAFAGCAENVGMPEKSAIEFMVEHYRLIRPVLQENPPQLDTEGSNVVV
ncbi:MAG TPA: hypothetical protein VFP95_07170 [Gammaproteobacteria bacterium]|nr:hypothetical protein [Gammaproteobacteria bacterium]